jgi:acyl-coenzyme A synthetase/AMP-(fatty) acid ligase
MEAAAVGVPAPGGGPEQLVLFLVPQGARKSADAVKGQCQAAIRSKLNPLFKVDRVRNKLLDYRSKSHSMSSPLMLHKCSWLQVLWRDSLPRTASNKVMRRVLRDELKHQSRL